MEETAVWNEINTDFDPEEETANFGTRHALEAAGNLYEVVTCLVLCLGYILMNHHLYRW